MKKFILFSLILIVTFVTAGMLILFVDVMFSTGVTSEIIGATVSTTTKIVSGFMFTMSVLVLFIYCKVFEMNYFN